MDLINKVESIINSFTKDEIEDFNTVKSISLDYCELSKVLSSLKAIELYDETMERCLNKYWI